MRGERWWLWALAPVALVGLPVWSAFSHVALGHPLADTFNHVWGYHHVYSRLLAGQDVFFTPLKGFPSGGALYFIDLFGALVTLPIQALAGPVAAYNAYCLGNLLFFGIAGGAWVRRLTRAPEAAAFAAGTLPLLPHLLGQAHNGISETLAVGWLALTLWALRRMGEEGGGGVALGVALGGAAAANPYYGLFALGVVGVQILGWEREGWARRRPLALAAGISAALAAPFAWALRSTLDRPDALVGRAEGFVWQTLVGHNRSDVFALFHPGDYHSPDLKLLFDEDMLAITYPGWALILLAVVGGRVEGSRTARGLWIGAILAAVLSLGPFLYVDGQYYRPGEVWVPLPFAALFDLVPAVARIAHPQRLSVLVGLCLTGLAGLAIARARALSPALTPALTPARAALLAGVLVSAEAWWGSPARTPIASADASIPPVYDEIRALEGGEVHGVLDLPASLSMLARARYDLYQTAHHQGIPYGLNDPTPPALWANPLTRLLLTLERTPAGSLPPRLPWLELELGRRALVEEGYRHVLLHPELPSAQAATIQSLLTQLCGAPKNEGGILWFRLDNM